MALPSIRQLEYFISAAHIGTFSGAAEQHRIAQPSVSEQISLLERTLETRLFTRTPRGLLLTDAGRQLLPIAEQTLESVRGFAESSRRIRAVEAGRVSFGTFSSAHLYLLTDVIRDFRTQHPGVQVHTMGLNSSEVANAVRSGDLEAGLVQLPVDAENLTVTPTVFRDEVVAVSKEPFEVTELDIVQLTERDLILSESSWANDDPLRRTLLERAQSAGVTLNPVIEVEFLTHALEVAAAGLGTTLTSYSVGLSMIKRFDLHWASLNPKYEDHYAFITRTNGSVSPATAEFMRTAHRRLQRLSAELPTATSR